MDAIDGLAQWLYERTPEELAKLIDDRAHLFAYGQRTATMRHLAQHLLHDHQTFLRLREIDNPEMVVLTAIAEQVREETGQQSSYYRTVIHAIDEHELITELGPQARQVIERLKGQLLLLPLGQGTTGVHSQVAAFFAGRAHRPRPVARAMTSSYDKAAVQRIADRLGIEAGTRTAAQEEIVAYLNDPGRVRELLSTAPAGARTMLRRLADARAVLATHCFQQGSGKYVFRPGGSGDPDTDWLADHGLIMPLAGNRAEVPAEILKALGAKPNLTAPPDAGHGPADPDRVRGQAQSAASAALSTLGSLLQSIAAQPVTMRKSGGVAVRETRRLAKALAVGEDETRFWIELSAEAGLIAPENPSWRDNAPELLPTEAYDGWLTLPPTQRLGPVIAAWYEANALITWQRDDEKPVALDGDRDQTAAGLRLGVLRTLAALPDGAPARGDLAESASWHRPMCVDHEACDRIAATIREAELLGVVADGAITPAGRALAEGKDPAVPLADLLPEPQRIAHFQADLTAVVAGVPAPELAALLGSAAERESEGHAVVWRFSPASVRRSLDAGADAGQLIRELGEVASASLPQPLEYLITDTARRHGQIKVVRSGCCIRSDDEALLAEIAAHRSLRKLGLRRIAPTVVIAAKPAPDTLEALRSAGYTPTLEAATGDTIIERGPQRRATAPEVHDVSVVDGLRMARRLLAGHHEQLELDR